MTVILIAGPTASGKSALALGLAQMRGGTSWEQVQAALLTSAEFQARVNGLAGDPNQSFIAGLYLRVLGRSASSADLAFWVGVLNTP